MAESCGDNPDLQFQPTRVNSVLQCQLHQNIRRMAKSRRELGGLLRTHATSTALNVAEVLARDTQLGGEFTLRHFFADAQGPDRLAKIQRLAKNLPFEISARGAFRFPCSHGDSPPQPPHS